MAKYKDLSVDGTRNDLPTQGGFNELGEGLRTTVIKDQSVVSEAALNKMATSIPTPFARLYLYDTAFKELNAIEATDEGKGRAYKTEPRFATLYHHLVSECFDLLEFIFKYGNDPRFTVHEWDANLDTLLLGAEDIANGRIIEDEPVGNSHVVDVTAAKHKKLGQALRDAVINTELNAAPKIFIFKWDGEIIGGTSPFTLVYTSPNWRRKMREKNLAFFDGQGHQLFPAISATTQVYSLRERDAEFRTYIYALKSNFYTHFNQPRLANLSKYIENSMNNYEVKYNGTIENKTRALVDYEELRANNLEQKFEAVYAKLKDTTAEGSSSDRPVVPEMVQAAGIPFYVGIDKPDSNSAYIIVPTVATEDLPKEKSANGQVIEMSEQLPMLLTSSRLAGNARYWKQTPYNPAHLPARPEGEYFERVLPGVPGNPKYPYLTENDIFEDSIMWLGYKVNKERFVTGFNGDCGFLLPIKPNFFKYFRVEDVEKMVKVTPEPFPLSPKVTVSIDIPVKGGSIRISRTYEKSKPGNYIDFPTLGSFKLGVFPFYTYAGTEAADEDIYKVLLARMSDVELTFYNRDFVTPLGPNVVSNKIRTKATDQRITTEYYTVGTPMTGEGAQNNPGSFTAIRVIKDGVGGIIIPRFKQAEVRDENYVFCVDFGTANTNVAYAKTVLTPTNGEPEPRVLEDQIHTLEYTPESMQMAMLNEDGSEGRAIDLNKFVFSEFVPSQIGVGDVKFPTRTIVCRRADEFDGTPELFGDTNIAFYTDKYGNTREYGYVTELKWGQNTDKINANFFQEIMWMCKNKVAELGGKPKFNFYYTYPQTMSNATRMGRGWANAALNVRSKAHVIDNSVKSVNGRSLKIYEGVAPWYRAVSMKDAGIFHNDDFLNIDIGGGSTDAIYITRPINSGSGREMQGYSFSAKFAANDLWGDGVGGDVRNNGFLSFFEQKIYPYLREEYKNRYDEYRGRATGSADLISYLFSHKEYEFSEHLENDDYLRLPMLMHFAATIYYAARSLAIQQLALPKHISFSGMGSLYLTYITEDTDILADIIKSIFTFVGFKGVDKEGNPRELKVHMMPNPKKITAEGGVLMFNTTRQGLTDKVVRSDELNFHLYDGEEEEEEVEIKIKDLGNYKQRTVDEVKKFLKLFDDPGFRKAISNLDGSLPNFDMNSIKGDLADGYDLAQTFEYPFTNNDDLEIKDVLFFWPLKHAIFKLALDMANKTDGGRN